MCMFCSSDENTNPTGLIWVNSEGYIYLRLVLKKIGNNCLWELRLHYENSVGQKHVSCLL